MRVGLFQGTFDPVTKGHIDIIKRATKLFDKLYVLVAINQNKKTLFTKDERLQMLKKCLKDYDNVIVECYDGLTVEFAKNHNVSCFVRGLRNINDFEYEKIEESYNKDLDDSIDTLYFTNDKNLSYISSTGVRELIRYGKDISKYVENSVIEMINNKKKEDSSWLQVI